MYYLSNRCGQQIDDPFVRNSNHALAIDFNDPMTDSNASSFRDPASQKAAYLLDRRAGMMGEEEDEDDGEKEFQCECEKSEKRHKRHKEKEGRSFVRKAAGMREKRQG